MTSYLLTNETWKSKHSSSDQFPQQGNKVEAIGISFSPLFYVLKKVSQGHWQSLTSTDDPRTDFVTLFLFLLSLEEWKQNSVMPCIAPWGLHRLFADGKCIVPCAADLGSASVVLWKQVNHFLTLIPPSFCTGFFPLIMRFICSNALLLLYYRVGTPNLLQQR